MSEQNKQVPRLRFPGFTDAWVKCELGDVAEIVGGGTPSTSILEYWNGEINWYSPVEIGNQIYVSSSQNKITKLGLEKSSAKILPAYKTILFTSRAGIGNTAIMTTNGATNQGFQSLVIKEKTDLYFLYSISSKIKEMALQIASGSTFLEISGKSLSSLEILVPNFEEQTKIGKFFQHLDNLITVNERELNKLKNLKKSYLEKMFPKNGSNIPELRFPGYTDAWVKHMVKDIFTVTRGNVLATTKTTSIPTDKSIFPVYSSQTKNDGLMGYYDKFLFQNAITWTTDGANAGTVKYRRGKFYSTNVNGVLLGDFANKATAEILNRIAYKFVSKVGNPKLMNNVMAEIEIFLPNFEEQQRISNLLDKLDNLITVNERELKKLKELKKSYLNDMFV
jgi:type I restriction enzyme, S subunit